MSFQVVIAGAIVSATAYTVSEDGYEAQFSGDHLAHFILIKSIWPLILKARSEAFAPRIVSVSSQAHQYGAFRFDDLTFKDGAEYGRLTGYANAKTANLLFMTELSKRGKAKGVLAFGLHPGGRYQYDSNGQVLTTLCATNLKVILTNGFESMSEDEKKMLGTFICTTASVYALICVNIGIVNPDGSYTEMITSQLKDMNQGATSYVQ